MMTPKQRLLARLEGKPVDKVPNLSIVMQIAAQYAGIPYGRYCSDAHAHVESQIRTAEHFGLDILTVMSDPYRETSAYQAQIEYQEDNLPLCKNKVLRDIAQWQEQLKPWNPLESERTLGTINAVRLFKAQKGDEYPIAGWVEGAFAELCDLAGVTEGMTMLFDDEEKAMEAMTFLSDQAILYAKAQIEAGADFIGIGDAVASLISTDMYEELVMPHEIRMIEAIHALGARVKLHICGNINHLLPAMVGTGADIIDIDYMVDLAEALKLAQDKCSICGNLNPAGLILNGTPAQIREETLRCVAMGTPTFLLSSGCEVPKGTPDENFCAIDRALRE
ncbi:MAG: uroporphyrinogen decarboxylase family protein [Clostridia bacterium]